MARPPKRKDDTPPVTPPREPTDLRDVYACLAALRGTVTFSIDLETMRADRR